jgi:anti-sigma factor RsiW
MNCRDVKELLNDYIDDQLQEDVRREVELHIGHCEVCKQEERLLRKFIEEAGDLPKGITPSRDLWPGVAARIRKGEIPKPIFGKIRSGSLWSNRGLIAAAAVLVVVIATALTTTIINNRRIPQVSPIEQSPIAIVPTAAMPADYQSAQLEYQQATVKLLGMLNERRHTLSPETLAVVDENIRIIDQAIKEIREALEKEPGSPQLNTLLLATYKQEVELLKWVAQLPTQI